MKNKTFDVTNQDIVRTQYNAMKYNSVQAI